MKKKFLLNGKIFILASFKKLIASGISSLLQILIKASRHCEEARRSNPYFYVERLMGLVPRNDWQTAET
jgi:hypothetical protein